MDKILQWQGLQRVSLYISYPNGENTPAQTNYIHLVAAGPRKSTIQILQRVIHCFPGVNDLRDLFQVFAQLSYYPFFL